MPSAKLIFSSVNNKLRARTHTIELPNQVALWLNKWFSPDGSPTELHSVVDYSCTQLSDTEARCVAWRLHIAPVDVSYFLHEMCPQSIRTMRFFCLYSYPCSSWIITKPHSVVTILCFLHSSKWPSASDWLRGTLLFAVWKKCNHALDVWTHFLSLLRSYFWPQRKSSWLKTALRPCTHDSPLNYIIKLTGFSFSDFFEVWIGWLNGTNTCRASILDHKSQQMTGAT